ncbi:DNA cytosine methyltransferase [Acidovorax sp. LjRoot117]|uniref:DNA cytosine methyltransferase n=1 Tax=Acidovorax sp. LjRoot117 TaxID=3342255 RepID=UPI003ECD2724
MTAYYNEIDPYAAQWLRNLINAGHIAPGIVDERSIEDVYPSDLRGFTQCHFFAGIGVWSHALRSAGWSDDRPVWTGSCPCQPFSAAGKGAGFDDERHLWPAFHHLIKECRPAIVFGEQVASSDAGPWLDLVQDDLEAMGHAFGAIPFPSAGVGAPHIRDRLYWVADANGSTGRQGSAHLRGRFAGGDAQPWAGLGGSGLPGGLAHQHGGGLGAMPIAELHHAEHHPEPCGGAGRLADASGGEHFASGAWADQRAMAGGDGALQAAPRAPGPTNGLWADADWLFCRDGKWRPVEPGSFPLVDGAPGGLGRVRADQERLAALVPRKDQGSRVGRLRAYGNAINAKAAQAFIECVMHA